MGQDRSRAAEAHLTAGVHRAARHVLGQYLRATECKRLTCFTDPDRLWLAGGFVSAARELGLEAALAELPATAAPDEVAERLASLGERDIIIAAFSDTTAAVGVRPEPSPAYRRLFPAFRSPDGFAGRSVFIRPRYPDEHLLRHLQTDVNLVDQAAARAMSLPSGKRLRVTAPGGTDLTLELRSSVALPYKVAGQSRHAYLPPSEVAWGIVAGSARGRLIADLTVGEVVVNGVVIDLLGVVDEAVTIEVADGRLTGIRGGDIARRLAVLVDRAGGGCDKLVELGFGLSRGIFTGSIAADECLQGTCHFGFGNDLFYGGTNDAPAHWDVVVRAPTVHVEPEPCAATRLT
ncbi:MAG: M29 family metallopeptidase [Bacillota bacterium]